MNYVDMKGKKIGFWKVKDKVENKNKAAFWLCVCKCGNEKIVKGSILRRGRSKSCGCWDSFENGFERALVNKTKRNKNGCLEWKGSRDRDGYARYGEKAYIVSRLVYKKHHGEIPEKMFICHKCDNPGCVEIKHLFLGSVKENNMDAYEKGRLSKGKNHHFSKITEDKVREIRGLYNTGVFQIELAKKFNLSQSQISSIVRKVSWKHVS